MKPVPLVCDAGPLILLAKLRRTDLILKHPAFHPVMMQCVADEILRGPFAPGEEEGLHLLTKQIPIQKRTGKPERSGSLSQCDLDSLGWVRSRAGAWLLADDRLLRRAANAVGVTVLGFPGLLIQHHQEGRVSSKSAIVLLDEAVSQHGYRISIQLYQKLLTRLQKK